MTKIETVSQNSVVKEQGTFIGKAWINTAKDGKVYLKLKVNQGMKVTLDESSKIALLTNTKRTGINPKTSKEYADADYSVLVGAN